MKTAIITGASNGIGQQIARLLAHNNYNVVIGYNTDKLSAQKLEEELVSQGLSAVACHADIAKAEDTAHLANFALQKFGKIDLLVNNAGICKTGLLIDLSADDIQNVISTNLVGTILMSKAVAGHMLSNQSGNIINISSIWGEIGGSCESVYSASKGGIIALTKALAKELGYNHIRVNCIAPGLVDTKMNSNLSEQDIADIVEDIPCGRMGNVDDIAQAVLWLDSDKASYINGQVLSINGGWNC